MLRNWRVLAAAGALALGGATVWTARSAEPAGTGAPPCVQWTGPETRHEAAGVVVARSEAAWRALWASHSGAKAEEGAMTRHAAPRIDFTRFMVVAYFRGPSTNTDGAVASDVLVGEKVRVRFEASTFQTAGPDGGAVKTRPFALWVVPRTDGAVVLEEGRRTLKGAPVKWVEVGEAPPGV